MSRRFKIGWVIFGLLLLSLLFWTYYPVISFYVFNAPNWIFASSATGMPTPYYLLLILGLVLSRVSLIIWTLLMAIAIKRSRHKYKFVLALILLLAPLEIYLSSYISGNEFPIIRSVVFNSLHQRFQESLDITISHVEFAETSPDKNQITFWILIENYGSLFQGNSPSKYKLNIHGQNSARKYGSIPVASLQLSPDSITTNRHFSDYISSISNVKVTEKTTDAMVIATLGEKNYKGEYSYDSRINNLSDLEGLRIDLEPADDTSALIFSRKPLYTKIYTPEQLFPKL